MKRLSFLIVGLWLACPLGHAAAQEPAWGPWEPPAETPALPAGALHQAEGMVGSATNGSQPWLLMLRTYQVLVSSQDAGSCPMYPTCSRFAMTAFGTYDPLQAFLMTADRLARDNHSAPHHHPAVKVGERLRLFDPPEAHRLW